MEGREFSLSGSCMSTSELEGTSLKICQFIAVAAAAIDADGVVKGGEVGSGSTPVLEERKDLEISAGKKCGRPRRNQPRMPPAKKIKDEEDVCFICFDGGSLVLCDRRGCPKAYHPVCVKRDDTFFRAKSRWNCGWHICSTCEKPAHYMCYTCTYSLCKKCSGGADFLCVRENKGFCSLCIKMIMLIENKEQREMDKVDFDDKTSWEYLFKMYWLYIKGKISLSLDEIANAESFLNATGNCIHKGTDMISASGSNDGTCQSKDLVVNRLRSKQSNQQLKLSQSTGSSALNKPGSANLCQTVAGSEKWASKELLAFVAHVKNGDESEISPHDAQVLLLDYVERKNLRDPNQTSQILCDTRLAKLFGKPRVGHFEMLKLLDFHFPTKDDSPKVVSQYNVDHGIVIEAEGNGNNHLFLMSNEKKRKNCTRGEENGFSTDPSEYAAIDVHNISLIYLRRRLLENLVNNIDKLHENVVGSIVRISFSGCAQKQEMFGLVQVIGTCKVPIPYKIGKEEKTVDVALEIFNKDRKETISIDAVSDDKFSEEECRHLKESIKCGLVKHLTVGLVQEKAKALREIIVNDCLEAEILRLNLLHDSANENGRENMVREYVERLEVLKSPEEKERRLKLVPEVHIDRSLNQNNKSAENSLEIEEMSEEVKHQKTEYSMNADGSSKSIGHFTSVAPDNVESRVVDSSGSAVGGCNSPAFISSASFSGVVSENSTGSAPLSHTNENDNFWLYRDQNGTLQGPFCLSQLRKWYTDGSLPSEMRTWSIYDDEPDSLFLTDVLKGRQSHKLSSRQSSISLPSENGSNSGLTLHKCLNINKTRSSPVWDSNQTLTTTINQGELDLNDTPLKACGDKVVHIEDLDEVYNNTLIVPASDMTRWLQMITEPIEFNTLDEESVSDLLDQVDAMESRAGEDFPSTGTMNNNNSIDFLFEDLTSHPNEEDLNRIGGHGQIIKACEFYRTGQCFKGALCKYLHQ